MGKPSKEALKELLRLVVLAVASVIITWFVSFLADVPQTETVILLTAFLRVIDKWIHEVGKDKNSEPLVGGLTRF